MIRLKIGWCGQDLAPTRPCSTSHADFHPLVRTVHFTRDFWRDSRAPLAVAHELAHAVLRHSHPGFPRAVLKLEAAAWRQVVQWRRRKGLPLTQKERAFIRQAYGSYQVAADLW